MSQRNSLDRDRIARDFDAVVNMDVGELEAWLAGEKSRQVGWKGRDGKAPESVGRIAGRQILVILSKPRDALDDDDYLHMRKVVGVIRRHVARRPQNEVTSRWRYALMNWGHDPLR